MRTIAKVPLRRGDVDVEFDQEMLAELLDQLPFNMAIADLYKTRFNGVPGVVYAAGVRHAYNVAEAFRDLGLKAQAVSGETPKRELAEILADYERGEIDVLINAQLLAEGWNSPRATVCMHLAPTASKRIYQQRVGRVTRRHPGKEAGVVVDFVHPATKHDDPVVTLHSLLDRDVYRGGAIVVGPVRRGRGRRVRVERRVIPVTAEEERRHEVFERELWRIAVEHLDYGEQHMWAALAGARVAPSGWRRARAMLHFDRTGELKRRFLLTAVERNRNSQLRVRALQEIAAAQGRRGLRPLDRRHRHLVARRAPRGRQGHVPGAGREAHRPPRPGQRLDLAAGRVHARGPRGVRGAALAGDQAPARPARQLQRRRARPQRPPPRPRGTQAGPPPAGGPARRRGGAHARGRGGAARRAHAPGPQAQRALARAAAQLPEGQGPALAAPAQEGGCRGGCGTGAVTQQANGTRRDRSESAPDEQVITEALASGQEEAATPEETTAPANGGEPEAKKPTARRSRRRKDPDPDGETVAGAATPGAEEPAAEKPPPKPRRTRKKPAAKDADGSADPSAEAA